MPKRNYLHYMIGDIGVKLDWDRSKPNSPRDAALRDALVAAVKAFCAKPNTDGAPDVAEESAPASGDQP